MNCPASWVTWILKQHRFARVHTPFYLKLSTIFSSHHHYLIKFIFCLFVRHFAVLQHIMLLFSPKISKGHHKINEMSPSQMECHIFSGLRVKLKSSCGAGRLHSFEHSQERNLEIQATIHNISHEDDPLIVYIYFKLNCKMGHVNIIAVMASEVLSIQYRGSLKAVLTSSLKPLSMTSWSDLWHPVVKIWATKVWMIYFHRGLDTNVMSTGWNTLNPSLEFSKKAITYPWQVVPVFSHAQVGQHT